MTQVLTPRDVPLGGLRAMRVRRTLPQRERSLVGAWCFADHYGPDEVDDTGGMVVPPHPHTGLQTVSWLFTGEIEHRDSAGHHALVRPGELNLMTGGRGISHSEVSTAGTTTLHGVQLWVALPDDARDGPADFEHYAPPALTGPGWQGRSSSVRRSATTSPVRTATPLLGAELAARARHHARARRRRDLRARRPPRLRLDRRRRPAGQAGRARVRRARAARPWRSRPSRRAGSSLLGGPPFGEQIVMWWNFVGRTHDEVVAAREEWQAQITRDGAVVADGQEVADGRFGIVVGDHLPPIPAPADADRPPQAARLKSRWFRDRR